MRKYLCARGQGTCLTRQGTTLTTITHLGKLGFASGTPPKITTNYDLFMLILRTQESKQTP